MVKGERWGYLTNGVTGIDMSTNIVKGKIYYYNMTDFNSRMQNIQALIDVFNDMISFGVVVFLIEHI